ncbi:MAG: MmgE/PrpD family protein [Burkholderiales bacterium]
MGITEKLACFAAETPFTAIPSAAIEASKLRCLDVLGVMVAGSRHPSALISLEVARRLGGHQVASVVGHSDRTSVELAGYLNAISAHALEYDDYTRMVTHLSVSLVPGALAIAEESEASGSKMLEGLIFGFQVATHVAKGLRPWLFDRGCSQAPGRKWAVSTSDRQESVRQRISSRKSSGHRPAYR